MYDIAIIGAGPCGLAVASRLCEKTPGAIFTEVEHNRYHWIKKHSERVSLVKSKGRAVNMRFEKTCPSSCINHEHSMVVLDATSNTWLARWDSLFRAFNISHLRSPLFFHVDPRDRDGLKEFAYSRDRESELVELPGVVGREVSKHHKKKSRSNRRWNTDRKLRYVNREK